MNIIKLVALIIVLMSFLTNAQSPPPVDPSVNYEYKKYQKFDLGNLAIKGSVLTPGDVSVKDRLPSSMIHDVYNRTNFNDQMDKDIQDIK